MLNRVAIIVRGNEPYVAWAKALYPDEMDPTEGGEETVYLVPDFEDQAGYERTLKKVWAEIFERELFGWCTDESMWPQRRTLAMFKKWFESEFHTVIEDLCDWPLEDDEDKSFDG